MPLQLYRKGLWPSTGGRPPAVLGAVFWVLLLTTVLVQVVRVHYGGGRPRFGLAVVLAVTAAPAVSWQLLPWEANAPRGRLLAILAFLAAGLAALWVTDYGVPGWTLLLGVTNAVLLYGVAGGAGYSVAILATLFAGTLVYPGHGLRDAVYQTAVATFLYGLAIAAAATFVELQRAHAQLRRLSDRTAELAIAEERARVAREMHDSIGHHLTVVKMGLENAERFRTRSPETAWQEVRQAKLLTQEALNEVRRCVRALRPLSLEREVAPRAMAALVDSFAATGMEVAFDVSGPERQMAPDAELVLYRALQEGLTNAARHSGARRVRASLEFATEQVVLAVEDDGRRADGDARERGSGLAELGRRARSVGGRVAVETRAGGGFTLRVGVPIART